MKLARTLLFSLALTSSLVAQDPRISSWYTEGSGRYARLFPTLTEEAAGTPVTTWSRGQGTQTLPTYAGIHEVCYSNDWVYVRASGLGSHIMGPWYGNEAQTNLFPNYPANRGVLYRVPRNPQVPGSKTLTGLGVIGIFVDGVSMFDSRDAFSYSNANGADERPNSNFNGDDIWNRDAYVNESVTFDAANAHQAGFNYHYHANPPALRHLLGDAVDYDANTNTYTELPNPTRHSPILGWVRDGFPIYGPYGYSNPNDPNSGVRRMSSGYQKRDGTNGTTNLAVTGRTTLPPWAAASQNRPAVLAANQYGPAVSTQYVLGHYIEDYDYKGDLGMTHGADFDLDQYNGRYCVTPEFPGGTYAYFVAMEADGTPVYPYNIGRWFFGSPTGNNVNSITEPVEKTFEGGPETADAAQSVAVDRSTGDVTIQWDGVEGAEYEIDYSPNLAIWKTMSGSMMADSDRPAAMDAGIANLESSQFYRIRRVGLSGFDSNGFDYTPTNYDNLSEITVTLNGSAPADLGVDPTALAFNGQTAIYVGRPSQNQITLRLDLSGFPDGDYPVSAAFEGLGTLTGNHTVGGGGPVNNGNNVLLIIMDDWGIDRSPIDNTTPGAVLPNMPTLQSLASSGLRFTNAYAQPICSPTRATILTGRHPFRHGVGNPQANSTLPASELTVPEILTQQSAGYATGSFGKWHLGGNQSGPFNTGGWQVFKGIRGGGVGDYSLWDKLEVVNGVATQTNDYTVYTTTDQVNDAVTWITDQGSDPWFCWMGFNAPHTPFHEPPANLAPTGGYSSQTGNEGMYLRMLEALDTEIGRLLGAVDLNKTNVFVIGDNGTPNGVVQAPFGNGNSKGDLYQGGVRVPFVASGPDVTVANGSTSDKLVHCIDLFSTILQLCGVDPGPATTSVDVIDSTSLLPILRGSDSQERCVVVEKFGMNAFDGRAIVSDQYPDYKLIIFGDRLSDTDTPSFEFYNITNDVNEQSPLNIASLNPTQQAAYDHLIAKDAALGGGYSDPPAGGGGAQTIYVELPNPGTPQVPPLIAAQGPNAGNALHPTSVTVGGQTANFDTSALPDGNPASRVNASDDSNRYWVKIEFDPVAAGLSSGTYPIVVTFPGMNPRVYTALNSFVVP
jgi:arylsulfatase A-like enzyme